MLGVFSQYRILRMYDQIFRILNFQKTGGLQFSEDNQGTMFLGPNSDFEVMQPFSEILGKQRKQCLLFAKLVFQFQPFLCYYKVNLDLLISLITITLQSKWFLEKKMSSMRWFLQDDEDAKLSSRTG